MIRSTWLNKVLFWTFVLIIGVCILVYAQHYLEIKTFIEASIESNNELNNSSIDYSAIWGAFGDYVAGFLNPIIGLISVFLLLMTWITTAKTLEHTKDELKESRNIQKEMQKTQLLQQFDSFFFPFLAQLKSQENLLLVIQSESALSELDKLYERIFGNSEYPLAEPNEELRKNHIFNSYFLCLIEILKNIDNKFPEEKETAQIYANIVKATMPMKLQQLMALFLSDNQSYLDLFIKYKFFENTSLRVVNSNSLSPLMIAIVQSFSTDIFGNFRNLLDIFGSSKELVRLKSFSTIFKDMLMQQSEMTVSGLGILSKHILNFSKINITFDIGEKEKEFFIIERKYSLILNIEKRRGNTIQTSKFIQNEEIYINKILLDFDSYQISVFGEHLTIAKNDDYVQSKFDREYLVTKEDTDEVIHIASSVDIIKTPL